MAEKTEILRYITSLAEQGLISRTEMNSAYSAGLTAGKKDETVTPVNKLGAAVSLSQILFYIGGSIVFMGMVIFVGQNWENLGFGSRLMATLVAGVAAYVVGVVFSNDERTESVAPAFFLISALITPIGIFVLMDNAGIEASGYGYQTIISSILLLTYVLSYLVYRRTIFVLFTILFGTWFFFSITSYLFAVGKQFDEGDFYAYRAMIAGVSYVFLARALDDSEHASLTGFLNNFGVFAVLAAGLSLGGSREAAELLWEVIYPGLVFGVIFLSVQFKSKAFLVWGTVFLVAYIFKITGEHFSRGFGWPLALVIAGLALIGVGYMSISIKKKYISGV